jgi:transposase-like protein
MTETSDQLELIPPFCPNFSCLFHLGTNQKFYVKNGWTVTDRPPFKNQRFKCRHCKKQFSANTFSLDFRKRVAKISERILFYSMNGMTNNSISKRLSVAEATVRDRLKVMAQQALIFEKQNAPKEIKEHIAYDGFETFTYSQFSPCYINTAVGSESMFIYHNTFSPLNRKGRMTDEQKKKNKKLILQHGTYPKDSVFEETKYVLKNLSEKASGKILFTDEHKSYLRAIKSFDFKMSHESVSSTLRRDSSNPLFPINRLHNMYRHYFSSQHRETIAFQKHEAALMDKIQLMKIYQNFMRPKFVKKNKIDPHAHECFPAMYVEVAKKVLNFEEFFGIKRHETQVQLDQKEKDFMKRVYLFSRKKIVG